MRDIQSQIAKTAQGMIEGNVNYFEGAELLLSLREEAGVYANDPDFVVFVSILNDVDYLRADGYAFDWHLLEEPSLQKQLAESLEWAKALSLENCQSLVKRYAKAKLS